MLTVVSKKEVVDVVCDMSGYTPFVAEFSDERTPTPVYWRIGDFDRSLIEIGLNENSGCVSNVALVMFSEESVSRAVGREELEIEIGMPVFDIRELTESGGLDNHYNFRIIVNRDSLRLLFIDDIKPVKVYRNKSVDFGVGEGGELVWLEFFSLEEGALFELI